jgi:hypothetical protein
MLGSDHWTSDPLFAPPKESSDIRRRELTKSFVDRYGEVPIFQVADDIVAEWLAGGGRAGTVMGLSSMFNDAASMKAGRLIDRKSWGSHAGAAGAISSRLQRRKPGRSSSAPA